MREYSEKLLSNIDKENNKLTTTDSFTTCIETIYGVTFMAMVSENKLIDELKDKILILKKLLIINWKLLIEVN